LIYNRFPVKPGMTGWFYIQRLDYSKRSRNFVEEELEIEGVIGKGVALLSP
jgi:hypothetical protein